MECIFCKTKYSYVVKNGRDRMGKQRYKCDNCKKTFTSATIQNFIELKSKRLVLHLILAGCKTYEIAQELKIPERKINGWKKLHLKELSAILPEQPLLSIITLSFIYKAIEKRRIAAIHGLDIRRRNKRRYSDI
jgi:transposase-like protein